MHLRLVILILFLQVFIDQDVLAQLDSSSVIVENYTKMSPDEAVRCILIDKQNYKWLGTDQGLYRIIGLDLEPEKLISDSITALAEDKKGTVWYANRKAEISTFDQSTIIPIQTKNTEILCMSYYKGDIWVGTTNGLYRISDDQLKILNHYTSENSKLKSNHINSLYSDPEGTFWIGTDAGVVIIKDKNWTHYEKEHKINGAISTKEGIWLLAEKKMWLIYKEDGRDRWQDAAVKRGLSQGPIRALVSDSKGNVYIASEILVQFNPYTDQSIIIDKDYGFVSSQTFSLACDKNDDLWVGTADRGMFRLDFLDGKVEQLTAIAFSKGELKCPGDKTATLTLVVKGGKTPYSYQWSPFGWATQKVDSVGAGNYQVTITDAEGEEYITAVQVRGPEPFSSKVISKERVSDITLKDGKANIQITGGSAPYRVIWDNGRNGLQVTNLSAGRHLVKVYDQNQCYYTTEVYIEAPRALPELDRQKLSVGQTLRINQLYFMADSSIISDESYPVLDEIFQFLAKNKDVTIEIGGHTNGIPPHEYCDRLSSQRAKNVAQYLYDKGIAVDQISFRGYGKRVPLASNDTVSGRQKNQRVEIKIVSISE